MDNKKKFNSLQQEILLQEQLTVANEINKLEHEIANGVVNVARNNRFRFWVWFIIIFTFLIFAIYVLVILLLPGILNISLEMQKTIIFGSSLIMVLVPIFAILYMIASSLRIKKKNALQSRVNRVMLTRLSRYYKMLLFEFDPERYKVYDDSYVVDIDENGNLIKYVRFYNDDGSITTKPFKSIEELRKYINEAEELRRLKLENEELAKQTRKLENLNKTFNTFDLIDDTSVSKTVVSPANILITKLVKENTDLYPDQYEDKVFKWFNKEDYKDAADFIDSLRGNILANSWDNGETVITDASWLKGDFDNTRNKKNSSLFFKNYDLQKELSQTDDIVSFVNSIKNFDLGKNPAIDWVNTIDPKDVNQEKLLEYNRLIKEYEDRAAELTKEQIRLETILKNDKSNILRVQLIDNIGVDTYEKFDPYRNIRKELEKQELRVQEIQKSKEMFKKFGIDEVNFEGLTIKEIKKITEMKVKEAKRLKELNEAENVDQLVALNNEIARIKNEKFKEIHLPNERYENEQGRWEYHDGAGNYFELDDNGEWQPTIHAAEAFEQNKEVRIAKAQQKYYDQQLKKTEHDKEEMERRVREMEELQELKHTKAERQRKSREERQEAKRLAKEAKLKQKQLLKESKELERQESAEFEKQFDNKTSKYVEIHPANEPFIGPNGRYVYHDGMGNYFETNEYNEWVAIAPLDTNDNPFRVIEDKEKKKIQKQQMKDLKKRQEALEKEIQDNQNLDPYNVDQSQQAFNQDYQAYDQTYNQAYDQTYDQAYNQTDTQAYDQAYDNSQAAAGGGQQWTDENGTTWYLDEVGNYYWWDGANWVPYQA